MRLKLYFVIFFIVIFSSANQSNAVFFKSLGSYTINAVSSHGSVVVGSWGGDAIKWSPNGGMTKLGYLPDRNVSHSMDVSADGLVVVGHSDGEAFRWTQDIGMTGLGYLPGHTYSRAYGVSGNGTVVVGDSRLLFDSYEAFRWTQEDGMVGLGYLPGGSDSTANDVSVDGSIVVGGSGTVSPYYWEAFRWTQEDGMVGLGYLSGHSASTATHISADGNVVVGYSSITDISGSPYHSEAFRWTEDEGVVSLGSYEGHSFPYGISSDGSIVVGTLGEFGNDAFIWNETKGLQSLQDVLTNEFGLDLSGWDLRTAEAISSDGNTIIGGGYHNGSWASWIAFIGPPCFLDARFDETILENGIEYYTDRDYTLTSVPPAYVGMNAIITPNDDRERTDSSGYLTFDMPYDGILCVAYDSRSISLPDWMSSFIDTGDIIETSLSLQPSLKIYCQNSAGEFCVNFGANKAPGFTGDIVSNYLVFYGPEESTEVLQLTNNEYNDTDPQIHNDQVVWQGYDGNDNEIYFWDGYIVTQLTNNNFDDNYPDIHNSQVVWQRHDGNDNEIYFWDGLSVRQLTKNNYQDSYPKVHDGMVVWEQSDGANYWEIFLWDGTNVKQITDNDYRDRNPQIHNGQVVWLGYDDNDYEIYLWDGVSTNPITNSHYPKYNPQIYNGHVVWTGEDNGDSEIFYWDGSNVHQITDNIYDDSRPQIYNDQIVWHGFDGHDDEIFLWNGSSVKKLTDNDYDDRYPKIYNGQVAWHCYDGIKEKIFLWDDSGAVQVIGSEYDSGVPQIHKGQVVWYSNDGNDREIFYYPMGPSDSPNYYVDGDITTSGKGTSWSESFKTIQEAINASIDGDTIMVKRGTYYINSFINVDKRVFIYGGFNGTETQISQRNIRTNRTIIDGQDTLSCINLRDNATLDGFTIANGSTAWGGGGIYIASFAPKVTNCTFLNNSAGTNGGGAIHSWNASPTITNSLFIGNFGGSNGGGAIFNWDCPEVTVTNCTFSENEGGDYGGGAIKNYNSNILLTNSILWNDDAIMGNEIYNEGGTLTIGYCDLSGGIGGVVNVGGGVVNSDGSNIESDPYFINPALRELQLNSASPCIDAGNNMAPYLPTIDRDGLPRKVDVSSVPDTGNGTAPIVDMGAYEYDSCAADLDKDDDIDGKDLAIFAEGNATINFEAFTENFGKVNCQ
jgi:uncharacterized membrane protein